MQTEAPATALYLPAAQSTQPVSESAPAAEILPAGQAVETGQRRVTFARQRQRNFTFARKRSKRKVHPKRKVHITTMARAGLPTHRHTSSCRDRRTFRRWWKSRSRPGCHCGSHCNRADRCCSRPRRSQRQQCRRRCKSSCDSTRRHTWSASAGREAVSLVVLTACARTGALAPEQNS